MKLKGEMQRQESPEHQADGRGFRWGWSGYTVAVVYTIFNLYTIFISIVLISIFIMRRLYACL